MLNNLFTCYCSGVSCVRHDLQVTQLPLFKYKQHLCAQGFGQHMWAMAHTPEHCSKPFLSLQPSNMMLFVCHSCQGLKSLSGTVNPS